MAMIPSVFAILVTFLGMRLLGGSLNVATILIATTVLGTTENDQIHFFHHLQEGGGAGRARRGACATRCGSRGGPSSSPRSSTPPASSGLAFSSFPPLRQFGVVTVGGLPARDAGRLHRAAGLALDRAARAAAPVAGTGRATRW